MAVALDTFAVNAATDGEEQERVRLHVVFDRQEGGGAIAADRPVRADRDLPVTATSDHMQAILAAVNDALMAERHRGMQDSGAVRAELEQARSDADVAVAQLTSALDHVRHLSGQTDALRRDAAAQSHWEEIAQALEAQLAEERSFLAELQERLTVVTDGRAAAEEAAAKARAAADSARRESAALRSELAARDEAALAGGESGAMMLEDEDDMSLMPVTAMLPMQVSAVADVLSDDGGRMGIGAVFDIQLAAAIPLDQTEDVEISSQVIDKVIALAREMHPTAALTLAFGTEEQRAIARGKYPEVTFVAVDGDDRRCKAAHVLAAAAHNLPL
jgi:hypothetical protein